MNIAKKILVVCYSRTGNTGRVAADLARRLDADIENIRDAQHGAGLFGQIMGAYRAWREVPGVIAPVQHDPLRYAMVIVGTPVWAGRMTPTVRAYLEKFKGSLHNRAFFVTSGDTVVANVAPALEAVANCTAIASLGLNARELSDLARYEAKIAAFAQSIRDVTASRTTAQATS